MGKMEKMENQKEELTKEEQSDRNQSIIFLNSPVQSLEDDVIGFQTQINDIQEAIRQGARTIGVIANYGTGKSSLFDMFANEVEDSETVKISLWDSFYKSRNISQDTSTSPEEATINSITKGFLYQLAVGIEKLVEKKKSAYENTLFDGFWKSFSEKTRTKFAAHINKRLSGYYNIVSFSTPKVEIYAFLVIAIIFFSGFFVSKEMVNTYPLAAIVSVICLFATIIFTILGIKDTCIAISKWKSTDKRNIEINDVYATYSEIMTYLYDIYFISKGISCKRVLIVIDDLDCTNDRNVILSFLKEIYRFQNLIPEKLKEHLVFVISLKPEMKLTESENTLFEDNTYTKLFDYIVSLRLLHYEDYEMTVLNMIEKLPLNAQNRIKKMSGISSEDTLPSSFYWLLKGENLTIRDLKNRMNVAVALYDSLGKKNLKGQQ